MSDTKVQKHFSRSAKHKRQIAEDKRRITTFYKHKGNDSKSENCIFVLPKDRADVRGGISQWVKFATPFRGVEKATPRMSWRKLNHGDVDINSSSFVHSNGTLSARCVTCLLDLFDSLAQQLKSAVQDFSNDDFNDY